MRLPNRHRFATLSALAVLLAAMSTGSLSLCEIFFGIDPEAGPDINETVPAGNTVNDFASLGSFYSRIALCDFPLTAESSRFIPAGANTQVPAGVFCRTNRDLRDKGIVSADLVTSTSTPPGVYVLQYRDASPGSYIIGTLNLTIEERAPSDVTACMAVFGKGEVILVNQTAQFYGCCSLAPENDPIVQYKWWFNYNGNPSSAPSQTTATCMTSTTYGTPGVKNTRLVVRTESGIEAEDTQQITVFNPR